MANLGDKPTEDKGISPISWHMTMVWAVGFGLFGGHRLAVSRYGSGVAQLAMGFVGTTSLLLQQWPKRITAKAASYLSFGELLLGLVLLWAFADIYALFGARFKDQKGLTIEPKEGDIKALLTGVGVGVLLCIGLFLGLKVFPGGKASVYFRWSGVFMVPLCYIAFGLCFALGVAIPATWRRASLGAYSGAILLASGAMVTLGFVTTKFELLAASKALESAVPNAVIMLYLQYLAIALVPKAYAALLLAFVLGLGALLHAAALVASSKHWLRGAMGLGVAIAYLGVSYVWCKPKGIHITQMYMSFGALLALGLALLTFTPTPAPEDDEAQGSQTTSGPWPLIAVCGLMALFCGIAMGESFYLIKLGLSLSKVSADTKAAFLGSQMNYAALWKMNYLALAGGLLLGVWLVSLFLRSGDLLRWAPAFGLLVICAGSVMLFHGGSHHQIRTKLLGITKALGKPLQQQLQMYQKTPLSDSLQKKLSGAQSTKQITSLPQLLLVASHLGYNNRPGAITIIQKKGIFIANRRVDGATGKQTKHPYLRPKLHKSYQERAYRRKKIAKYNRSVRFRGKMQFLIEPDIPFQTVANTLYSAHKAGYRLLSFRFPSVEQYTHKQHRLNITGHPQLYPFRLGLWPANASAKAPKQPNLRPDKAKLQLIISADRLRLVKRSIPDKAAAPPARRETRAPKASKKATPAPKPSSAPPETLLWQERRKANAPLQGKGLREALLQYWKQSRPSDRTLLLSCGPKVPYLVLLNAIDAIHPPKGSINLWLAPLPQHKGGWTW